MMNELTIPLKQRLCKDFKLPIFIHEEPYFEYFMNTYDAMYETKKIQAMMLQVLAHCETQEDFFGKAQQLGQQMKEVIKATASYQQFCTMDIDKSYKITKNVSKKEIYIEEHAGKEMISVDLSKANFNCLQLVGMHEELNVKNYEDFIGRFTSHAYFMKSKMIRQVVFGDLNPVRQQRLQRYIIEAICNELSAHGCQINSASSDEVIIHNKSSITEVAAMLGPLRQQYPFIRIDKFSFEKVHEDFNFFIKTTTAEDGSEKKEFKNVPGILFPQVYKQHYGLAIEDPDLLFMHEGYRAKFEQHVFGQENKMKKNLKKP